MEPSSSNYSYCLEAMRESSFFAQLSDGVQQEILTLFHYERVLSRDTSIILDDAEPRFYLVVSGRAKVSVYHPETGREHILYLLGKSDGYNIVSLLDGKPHDAVATALDDMELLTTPLSTIREWILLHPDFNRTLLPYLGDQMRQLSDQVEDLSLYETETRLARLILRHLASDSPVHGLRLINDLSQETLASMIGSVRVVVAKHIQKWKKQEILSGKRGVWSVENLPALLKKAEDKYDAYLDKP
jgi:CRP-like cAMP-binding protein